MFSVTLISMNGPVWAVSDDMRLRLAKVCQGKTYSVKATYAHQHDRDVTFAVDVEKVGFGDEPVGRYFSSVFQNLTSGFPIVNGMSKAHDDHSADVQIVFVHIPLAMGRDAFIELLQLTKIGGGYARTLKSPWVYAGMGVPTECKFKIVVVWNERQLLVDQANLESGHPVSRGMAVPFGWARFGSKFDEMGYEFDAYYDEFKRRNIPRVATRMPEEAIWFYLNFLEPSGRAPGPNPSWAFQKRIATVAAKPQSNLVQLLTSTFLESDLPLHEIKTIFDFGREIENYQIPKPK